MQDMNLTEERVGDILVIRLDGRLDHEGGLAFERATSAQIELGCRSLVVDFCGVSFLASMGIRALITPNRLLAEKSGRLGIVNLSDDVLRVLELVGLSRALPIYGTMDEALAEGEWPAWSEE